MRITLLFVCLLAVLTVSGQSIKPYLQGARPNSLYVNWKTDNGDNPSVVLGIDPERLDQRFTGTTFVLDPKDTSYDTPYHYHQVHLTGLRPNTGYYYRAVSGKTDQSAVHYLRTPPARGAQPDKLRFIVLGDHQVLQWEEREYKKFDQLVAAAKAKAEEVYGKPLADHVQLILNDGDQVDLGKLAHYEQLHFKKSSPLTHELPLITAVGNHETYGKTYAGGGIQAYYDHFVLDDDGFAYGGLPSNTERYYAYQLANVLFTVLDTEQGDSLQAGWLRRVVEHAAEDAGVQWIVSIGHRPYEAEQYADDYSAWVGETAMPILQTTDKFALHIAGHHHLYARGQFLNHPAYHIISGGTAWPQYWGDSKLEIDRPETQMSHSNFAFQLVEIDNAAASLRVRSYTIGSLQREKDSELLDEFYLQRGVAVPQRPTLQEEDGELIGSAYVSPAGEPLNSSQFQLAADAGFVDIRHGNFRHVANWFGPLNGRTDETENVGLGQGIIRLKLATLDLAPGEYYGRVRYRDANLGWSAWSAPRRFKLE
ncbi:MAG: metallophosphoesterase family protein [Bacteroidota bacterium]